MQSATLSIGPMLLPDDVQPTPGPVSPKCICLHAGSIDAITTGAASVAAAFGLVAVVCLWRRAPGISRVLASLESTMIAGVTSLFFAILWRVLRSMPACNRRTGFDSLQDLLDGTIRNFNYILDITVGGYRDVMKFLGISSSFAKRIDQLLLIIVVGAAIVALRYALNVQLPATLQWPSGTWRWPTLAPPHKEDAPAEPPTSVPSPKEGRDAPAGPQVPIAPPTYVGENMVSLRSRVSALLGERCMPSKDLMKLPRAKLVAYCAESGLPRQ